MARRCFQSRKSSRGRSALKHGKEMFPISQLAEDARETGPSHVHDLHGALAEDTEETGADVNNCILMSQSRLDSLMIDYEYVHSARTRRSAKFSYTPPFIKAQLPVSRLGMGSETLNAEAPRPSLRLSPPLLKVFHKLASWRIHVISNKLLRHPVTALVILSLLYERLKRSIKREIFARVGDGQPINERLHPLDRDEGSKWRLKSL